MLMRDTKITLLNFPSTKNNILKFGKLLNNFDPKVEFYGKLTQEEVEDIVNELGMFWHDLHRGWNEHNPKDRI